MIFHTSSLTKIFRYGCCSIVIFILSFLIKDINSHTFASTITLPISSEPIKFYSNQTKDDLTTLYVKTIEKAQESIVFIIYSLKDRNILNALKTKENQGVSIYLICDAEATPKLTHQLPKSTIIRRKGKGLMHQKILVVDNELILLGSANMTIDSLNKHGNLVMGFSHPSLAAMMTARAKEMSPRGKLPAVKQLSTHCADQPIDFQILPFNNDAEKQLISLLKSAKKTIKVAMYTWTRHDFTQELIQASKRGVHVEAIIDRQSGMGTSSEIVKKLFRAGIPVKLSTGSSLLHHKFAYIDDGILINGSANWTYSAFNKNDDCFMVIYDLKTPQKDKMDQLWECLQKNSEFVKEKD